MKLEPMRTCCRILEIKRPIFFLLVMEHDGL